MQDEDHIGNNVKELENLAREKYDSSICYNIAEKFIKGDGVVKDLALASMWFDPHKKTPDFCLIRDCAGES